jgi:hypothetical protein
MKKYVLCPGHIKSKTDSQTHYIGCADLIRLYGVPASECIAIEPSSLFRRGPKLIYLRPRYNGDYSVKIAKEEQT